MKDITKTFMPELIRHLTASRHSILKEMWNHPENTRFMTHMQWRKNFHEQISRQITEIRNGAFHLVTDKALTEEFPVIADILAEDTADLKKSCIIMHILGFDDRTIADLLCINEIFVDFLYEEFPEYFK